MTEIFEWQLDAVAAVLRRCEVLSDFSEDQFVKTLYQMGFTIEPRDLPSVLDRVEQNCTRITPHEAHNWNRYMVGYRCPGVPRKYTAQNFPRCEKALPVDKGLHCESWYWGNPEHKCCQCGLRRSDVAGKPITQNRGPEFVNLIMDEAPVTAEEPSTQKTCAEYATHLPHGNCPGKESTEENRPSSEVVVTLEQALDKVPVDSAWIRQFMSETQSNECRVTGIFFKIIRGGKVFFVQYTDTWDNPSHMPFSVFLQNWERM